MNSKTISDGIQVLNQGGIIAYPSEGVWGLGCDPFDEKAVKKVIQLKQRSPKKGLILVASSLEQIKPLIEKLAPNLKLALEQNCPGPNTWLIPDTDQYIPSWIKGTFDSVAIRVSEHPIIQSLCDGFGGMIVSTSANLEGGAPAENEEEVREIFSDQIDKELQYIVSGETGSQKGSSKIIDLISLKVVRE